MLALKKFFIDLYYKGFYWSISNFDKDSSILFMNFGYANGNELVLAEKDEAYRYHIQLYEFLVNHTEIEGRDVLEVGSGRGGGAEYIARTHKPASYTGVDLSKKAIQFCKKQYSNNVLSFEQANALNLPFPNDSFDVVINVESSHRYPDMDKFLSEVYRVLKPTGRFLFTDFRATVDGVTVEFDVMDKLNEQIVNSKFKVIKRESITNNVVKALDVSEQRRLEQIERVTPRLFRSKFWNENFFYEFAAIKGTTVYGWLESGQCEYFFYLFEK